MQLPRAFVWYVKGEHTQGEHNTGNTAQEKGPFGAYGAAGRRRDAIRVSGGMLTVLRMSSPSGEPGSVVVTDHHGTRTGELGDYSWGGSSFAVNTYVCNAMAACAHMPHVMLFFADGIQ